MKVVIPIHDDFSHITEFQKVLVDNKNDVLFVFDRCEPPKGFNWNYKIHEDSRDCFLAGKVRSFGVEDIDDDVCFFDQDKVPDKNPFEIFKTLGKEKQVDCILMFTANDDRNRIFASKDFGYLGEAVKLYNSVHNFVYTSGFWISKEAMKEIKILNGGGLFNSAFDGAWGEEDQFLGDELIALGYNIGYTKVIHTKETPTGRLDGERVIPLVNQFTKRMQLRIGLSNAFLNPATIIWGKPLINKAFINVAALTLKQITDVILIKDAYNVIANDKDNSTSQWIVYNVNKIKGTGLPFKYMQSDDP